MAGLCDGQGMPTFSGADKPNREMHYPNFQGQQMLLLAGAGECLLGGWLWSGEPITYPWVCLKY